MKTADCSFSMVKVRSLMITLMIPLMVMMYMVAAAVFVQAREMPSLFRGVRPLGMGGAFSALADDHNALFYNPAGLDMVPGASFAVLNPLIEIGENGQDLYQDIQDTDFDQTGEVTALLRKHMGEHQHVRTCLFPHFVKQHFGFGVLGQAVVGAEINNPQYPEVDADVLVDVAGVGGAGFGFLQDNALRLGVAAKYVKRQQLKETYTAAQIASDDFDQIIEDDMGEGSGLGFDLGAIYTFSGFLKPSLALVIQNIGGTKLGDAGQIPQQINLGAGLSYQQGIISVKAGLDLVDITHNVNEDEDDFFRRVHLGAESWFGKRLALRLGLYQGYATAGVGLNLWLLKLDYANYAEEVGAYAGQRADRRHVVQLSLGW
ncbi:MAG: hypothetical protein K6U11_01095 [bacterium]|nr:hypothetical protein [bacterium]